MTELQWRLGIFLGMLLVMSVAEWVFPRRERVAPRTLRWTSHAVLTLINTLAGRFLVPLSAVQATHWAGESGWGLLRFVQWPNWLEFTLAVVLLDLAIYAQHVVFHHVPWLWKLHKVHHADVDLDASSGIRFHVLEIVVSAFLKLGLVVLIGPTALAVMVFEIVLNAGSIWSHANLRLPTSIDRWLRWVIVTPDMHRVHHSVELHETNSNYGFFLPWWDSLFGTYIDQPRRGQTEMTIGLDSPRAIQETCTVPAMLTMPFRKDLRERYEPSAESL